MFFRWIHSAIFKRASRKFFLSSAFLVYSSSSSSPPPAPPCPFFMFFLFTRPGRPPPNGDFNEKSMCFCESKRTTNDGMLTTCLRTLEMENFNVNDFVVKLMKLIKRFLIRILLAVYTFQSLFRQEVSD